MHQIVVPFFLLITLGACSDGVPRRFLMTTPAESGPEAPPQNSVKEELTALDPNSASPLFTSSPEKEAFDKFERRQWSDARREFSAALAGGASNHANELRLLVAVCDARLNNWASAAIGYSRSLAKFPAYADWLHYQIAWVSLRSGDLVTAATHAKQVAANSVQADAAWLILGDVLRSQENPAATAQHYLTYLERGAGLRRPEARYRVAEALEQQGKVFDAALHYRHIVTLAPLSPWAPRAQAKIDKLVAELPAEQAGNITTWTATELVANGDAYYQAMRNEQSEAQYSAALTAPKADPNTQCVAAYHRADSVFKQRNRTRAAPLFDEAYDKCKVVANETLTVKAAYNGGRSYANIGESETAIERYSRIERLFPHNSYADDARLRQAEEYRVLDQQDQVTRLLSSLPTRYPDGDMKAEAMWRLAWRAYKDKHYREAAKWLQRQIEVEPIADHWARTGQAQYWLGRVEGHLGNARESVSWYREAIRLYPLSYYALLALNRLREAHPSEFQATVVEISKPPSDDDSGRFNFRPREVYGSLAFKRALDFIRLGLTTDAQAELDRLGFRIPPGKDKLTDPDAIDRVWAMAFLFHAAQQYQRSHWVTRWHVLDYQRHWPTGEWRKKWQIAYPKGWWSLLQRHAQKQGYPTELQIAFVREESAFDPLLESFANAIGLTQMIIPTATRFAKGTGLTVSRQTLQNPESNVLIGSRFLGFLMQKWNNKIGLVVPSYNAGEGAVERWLKERGSWAMDEFAEEIPYDETRRYNKRVSATYFAYSYLNDGTIPEMPN